MSLLEMEATSIRASLGLSQAMKSSLSRRAGQTQYTPPT